MRENTIFESDRSGIQNQIITSVWQDIVEENTDSDQIIPPRCIRLNFDDLKSFEKLHNQFKHWGLIFDNSLVIQPSNPAFPSRSGLKVVMGSPKSGSLEVTFLRPASFVSALVTSSQRLVLSAYNQNGQLVNESVLGTANVVNSGSDIPPNALISVTASCIKRVNFCCFDGNFTLDEFRFCFAI
ncbi:hypothetical protein [Anabaena sp. UHCC 0451]|uniref:hypothetical protein n=1 Tax=Anabaena sp. UHCC 0451 TaxID=2055235 RepID=UPI002B1FAE19|nr:hypothetical protein [Anabaena sp. UHCC 0451]MEA5579522.1 hypothetical protein [Anabaena sp. UHCC 0451]